MSNWTQPMCDSCYSEHKPDRDPVRLIDREVETCCMCGDNTGSGIYVRIDPRTVPHPTLDEG